MSGAIKRLSTKNKKSVDDTATGAVFSTASTSIWRKIGSESVFCFLLLGAGAPVKCHSRCMSKTAKKTIPQKR